MVGTSFQKSKILRKNVHGNKSILYKVSLNFNSPPFEAKANKTMQNNESTKNLAMTIDVHNGLVGEIGLETERIRLIFLKKEASIYNIFYVIGI